MFVVIELVQPVDWIWQAGVQKMSVQSMNIMKFSNGLRFKQTTPTNKENINNIVQHNISKNQDENMLSPIGGII